MVVRYQARLITVLEHLVRERQLAEDLAQEVFLRVYRARKTYAPSAKFCTWLFTIVNNVAANAQRSRVRRKEVNVAANPGDSTGAMPLDQMALASSGQMPARQLDKTELRQIVRAAVGRLNERQRMAVLLNKFESLSYEDIAVAMDMSPKAVKSLLSRARENLRELLEPYLHRD
jgi:RNA polymerase sigma-70 factor (ECF subfamily)